MVASVVAIAALCCGGCGAGPRDQVAHHLDEMVSILEQHADDVDAAATAVEAYVRDNAAALKATREALARRQAELTKQDKKDARNSTALADYASELLLRIGPIMERARGLMEAHPDFQSNERLRKALESIGTL